MRCPAQGDPEKTQGKRAPALLEFMVPTPPSPDSKGHGHLANLSACHHRLIGPNSLWQVHVLPSTQRRWLKRSSNTNCCFQRKWSHSLGTGPMLGPQWQRKQTGGRPSRMRNMGPGGQGPGLQWQLSHMQAGGLRLNYLTELANPPYLWNWIIKRTYLMMLWGLKEIIPWMLSSSAARQIISPQELVKIA